MKIRMIFVILGILIMQPNACVLMNID